MPGPLPDPRRRRRNAPTIPTTNLPASGRSGVTPRVPRGYSLGDTGRAWWRWAWRSPQAAAWSDGDVYVVARRASLEDDLASLEVLDPADLAELLVVGQEAAERIVGIVGRWKALAAGRLGVLREMRELDDRLGLTPKGMAALRWQIVADQPGAEPDGRDDEVARRRETRQAALAALTSS